jgi:hypothetical protein
MPVCANPEEPVFFVYAFVANGCPFYVGIGRAARATDRLRYVRYLMDRERRGKPVKWVASNRVIAQLMQHGFTPELQYVVSHVDRTTALQREKEIIAGLRLEGRLLANRHHNGGESVTVENVVSAVLAHRAKRPSGLLA